MVHKTKDHLNGHKNTVDGLESILIRGQVPPSVVSETDLFSTPHVEPPKPFQAPRSSATLAPEGLLTQSSSLSRIGTIVSRMREIKQQVHACK